MTTEGTTSPPPPPSTRGYRVAVALAVVGLLAAAAWWPYATTRIFDAVETFERTGPFGGVVELPSPGPHTFWIEGACLSCHDNEPSEYRAAATVVVLGPTGSPVRLRPAPSRVFNTARREGRSLWRFDVERTGPHRITFDLDTGGDWDNQPPGNLAIGRGDGLPVGVVRPMTTFAVGGIAAGAAVAAVTAARRRRHYARTAS